MIRLIPVAALILALAVPTAANAADPIEGRWISAGTTILVSPLAGGGFHGIAVTQSPTYACVTPGTEVWPSITGSGPSYSGSVNLFSAQPCAPAGPAAASFALLGPTYGSVCVASGGPGPPGPCEAFVRAVACNNAVDDDADGDIDLADPGCDRATDENEAPDPVLAIGDQIAYEASAFAAVPVTLSQPVGRAVTFVATTSGGSASPGSDYVAPSVAPVQIPPGQTYAVVPISIVADGVAEPSESFTVQLGSVSGARLGRSVATVTIQDAAGGRGPQFDDTEVPSRTPRKTAPRGGSGGAVENLPVCGLAPPTFPGRPAKRKDGRQRCPKARPRNRSARGGSAGVDRMTGNSRANAFAGLGGNDTLRGLGGGDRLAGGRGDDRLWGGAGGDMLDGGDGDDRLHGGPGSDWLVEQRYGDDRLDGGPGDDVIAGNHGHDVIAGGAGDDIISGGSGPDTVDCGPGYDTLYVNLVSDRARSRGCERIRSEADIRQRTCGEGGTNAGEQVRGDSGDNTCRGRGGDDVLEGAGGSDRLYGGAGNDELFGRKGSELMYGGSGNDLLEGGQGADRMYGGTGSDVLNGGYGRDRLSGGAGNDTLNAGFGDRGEIVDCGPGYDTYVYGPGDKPRNCEVTRR